MFLGELIQCGPDQTLDRLWIHVGVQVTRDLGNRALTIAELPNPHGRAIQTMDFVPFHIIDEQFVDQLFDQETSAARLGLIHARICSPITFPRTYSAPRWRAFSLVR